MPITKILTQGIHFDAYENTERKGAHGGDIEFLCNVTSETFAMVKQGEYVKVDFDGDGKVLWGVVITKKDRKNNHMYYYMI